MSIQYYSQIVSPLSTTAMLDGRMFRWLYNSPLADSAVKNFLFLMPTNKTLVFHGREFSSGKASVRLDVYSGPTFSSEGTPFNNYINLNPDTSVTAEAQVWENPTLTNNGILIDVDLAWGSSTVGNRGSSGSASSREFPRIIPKSSYVLAKITHLGDSTAAAEVLYKLFWEEI